MGNRLSKIYTRTGDDGTTGLGDGSRIGKDSDRVEAYGTTDELNSVIGMVLAENIPDAISDHLANIQHDLFELGSELCVPGYKTITNDHVNYLEETLDALNEDLPMLKEFILPAGGRAAASCHLARTVCRRAERCTVRLKRDVEVNEAGIRYLNRLSDLLFVIARVLSRFEGGSEVLWEPKRRQALKPQPSED